MPDNRKRRFHPRGHAGRRNAPEEQEEFHTGESTGSEATDLRALVNSRSAVTVVLHSGERLQGRIRYYDRDCFSLGPSGGGPKIFLRKESVRYIVED